MSIVLQIIRSLPGMGYGFPTPVTQSHQTDTGKGGSTTFMLFLLIIVGGIFWYYYNNSLAKKNEHPRPDIEQNDTDNTSTNHIEPPRVLPTNSDITFSIGKKNDLKGHTNRAAVEYTIQVAAHSTIEAARQARADIHQNYPTDVVKDDDGLYKVVIGHFSTRVQADEYKEQHRIDGFVKELKIIHSYQI